jgi:flagellar hook-associated protein 3 FlgL
MGTARVTQQLLVTRVLNNLTQQQRSILRLQEQLATGRRINNPSDDPLVARRALRAQAGISRNAQYISNLSTSRPGLVETETALRTVIDVLQRTMELTLQGASGTNSQVQRDQIASEVNQILESVLVQSNHVTNDRYIFGGHRTGTEPFVPTRGAAGEISAVSYQGDNNFIQLEIGDGVRLDVNETGQRAFQQTIPGSEDIFQMLIAIRDNLRSGDVNGLQTRLSELDRSQDQILVSVARIGAVQNRLDATEANLRTISIQLEQVLSDNLDADFAEVIVELNAQSNAFQASLNAGARVIQPSLLDFIR